jgi:hypothetical protein
MMRACLHCHQPFTASDLSKFVSKEIEAERKSYGVQGILFRCYVCTACGQENLFVDLHPLEGETPDEFRRRRDDLETTLRQEPPAGVQVAVMEKVARPAMSPSFGPQSELTAW